ncbi:MAG: sigma-70 family RNA polymerase sigma factor [Gemmataceae bacterium]
MWPNPDTTARLLDDARTGTPAGTEALLAEFREPLRRMIGLRMDPALARRVDASDIVQDVLLEANQRLTDYLQKPDMPFHLWLRHLAQDRIIDTHRRHRLAQRRSIDREQSIHRPNISDDDSAASLLSHLVDTERTPATGAMLRELQERLTGAIDKLNEDDREIILMRHQELLTNQETAQVLQLSEAAASMRYLRAVRRLRGILIPDPPADASARSPE